MILEAVFLDRDGVLNPHIPGDYLYSADKLIVLPGIAQAVRREYARTFERKRLATVNIDELIASENLGLAASGVDAELAEMRRALFKLPDEYREPLVLQVLMGLSTAEIAREMGLTGAAVLTRLFRARRQMRVLCGEDTTMDPGE